MSASTQVMFNLVSPGFPACLKYVERHCATIFMLHRFRDDERGIHGAEPQHLRQALRYLTRQKYQLISLSDLFERLATPRGKPRGAVAFTMDDGYIDQATVAAPIFAEFRCPVTTFVSSGFLDGRLWLWWDRIEYVFRNTRHQALTVPLGNTPRSYRWTNVLERNAAQNDFTQGCKSVTDDEKIAAIVRLAIAADVDLPVAPPNEYAPMTWSHLRAAEDLGMTFGPHTVTHPLLSRTTDHQSRYELTESWNRIQAEARKPVPIFCYPNGRWEDFGPREVSTLNELGLIGAVAAETGYADTTSFQQSTDGPYRVRRFGFPDDMVSLVQYVSGIERLKQFVRRKR